ncbi:phosphoribosylglycinamide formyltransferase [Litchfieldia salsa]|uniref:Phosphoribosylglycinamide formyltransferase n=1 Tax=Litchfieldia salsa TaxID=930152 RepID=A0A1H0X1K1_9BACI|nr:phosphoribosylglycinamide formyltransferase [Litchfieldia salsa]SDP96821.1 formyltetrahydrofolate-dependent phosphoribosylglycinamide formyltransferase [Litchfieldia salsa]
MKKLAIFASGSGTNFQALADAIEAGILEAEISLLVCDKPGAKVIERAEAFAVETFVFTAKEFQSKVEFETLIVERLRELEIDLVVLAGYMRLIGPTLLAAYPNQIVNIHPSFLPSFPGKDAIGQAFAAGVEKTGVTVHFVDEGMDTGPIIAQEAIMIDVDDTLESLEQKIHEVEHVFYPKTLQGLLKELTVR